MDRPDDAEIIRNSARGLYGRGQPIWDPGDKWNSYKRSAIDDFARRYAADYARDEALTLDAGCGSEPYDWLNARAISLDLFSAQLVGRRQATVGDIDALPFRSGTFGFVIIIPQPIERRRGL